MDVARRRWLIGDVLEEGWVLHIGGVIAPLVDVAGGDVEPLPALIAGKDHRVFLAEHGRVDRGLDGGADFLPRRPDVMKIDGLSVRIAAYRIGGEIEIDRAGQRV